MSVVWVNQEQVAQYKGSEGNDVDDHPIPIAHSKYYWALCFQVAEVFWEPTAIVNQQDVMIPSEWVSLGNGGFTWF